MESSALNLAHQQQRRAESLLRCQRYRDAIECHERAYELLTKAEKETGAAAARQSIRSQCDYHMQQKKIIKLKQMHMERMGKAAEKETRERISSHPTEDDTAVVQRPALKEAIFRDIEETDSLLQLTFPLGIELLETLEEETKVPLGRKLPKDAQQVQEEVRLRIQHLREMIQVLLEELDAKDRKVHDLEHRLRETQAKLDALQGVRSPSPCASDATPSLDASASPPLLVSPFTDLVPESTPAVPPPLTRHLPPLAPLEMPHFDFNLFRPTEPVSAPGASPPS